MATTGQPLNLNSTTPFAPAGSVNISFQAEAPNPNPAVVRHGSAYVPLRDYDVVPALAGVQTVASQEVLRLAFARATNFAGNFSGSMGSAKTAATSPATFLVNKNGSQIGTIVWAGGSPASFTPTFTTTGGVAVSFAAGDVMTVVGPVTPDTTLANWSATLMGKLTY